MLVELANAGTAEFVWTGRFGTWTKIGDWPAFWPKLQSPWCAAAEEGAGTVRAAAVAPVGLPLPEVQLQLQLLQQATSALSAEATAATRHPTHDKCAVISQSKQCQDVLQDGNYKAENMQTGASTRSLLPHTHKRCQSWRENACFSIPSEACSEEARARFLGRAESPASLQGC